MTKIIFNSKGRPTWQHVDTGAFARDLNALRARYEFTGQDLAWFKGPIKPERMQ